MLRRKNKPMKSRSPVDEGAAGILPAYLFSAVVAQANGARTSVRRNVGKRRNLEISKRRFALPVFLRDKYRDGVWTFCGLKARHVTAWGEAHGAKPQVNIPNTSPPYKGGTFVGNAFSVPALQASRINLLRVSRASARDARSNPGCQIAGFQPASETRENVQEPGSTLLDERRLIVK